MGNIHIRNMTTATTLNKHNETLKETIDAKRSSLQFTVVQPAERGRKDQVLDFGSAGNFHGLKKKQNCFFFSMIPKLGLEIKSPGTDRPSMLTPPKPRQGGPQTQPQTMTTKAQKQNRKWPTAGRGEARALAAPLLRPSAHNPRAPRIPRALGVSLQVPAAAQPRASAQRPGHSCNPAPVRSRPTTHLPFAFSYNPADEARKKKKDADPAPPHSPN